MINLDNFKNLDAPYVLVLVSPPLGGKSFFCEKYKEEIDKNVIIISRDEILFELSDTTDYNLAFKCVKQSLVDKILKERLIEADNNEQNVIIDMDHVTIKSRNDSIKYFSKNYNKVAVIFPILSDSEYHNRNKSRMLKECKKISMSIVKRMINCYEPIDEDEKFNKVIHI